MVRLESKAGVGSSPSSLKEDVLLKGTFKPYFIFSLKEN